MLDRYLAALPAMSLIPFAPILHRGLPGALLCAALGKPGRLLRNLKARPRLWLRYGLRTMSSFVLGFGVCVRLLLSAFH